MTASIHTSATTIKSRIHIIKTFRDRDDWIKLLLAADGDTLSTTAKIVATRVAFHHNIETGRCDPSLDTLASGISMSARHVRRMLNELEEAGWLIVAKSVGGRRQGDDYNSHSFKLSVPVTRTGESGLNPDTVVRDNESNPDKPGRLTRTNGVANPDTVVRQEKSESTAKRTAKKKDSLQPRLDLDEDRRREVVPASPPESNNTDDGFPEFYSQYPKRVARAAAEKAYRGVITKGLATPEQLINGAMRYAAERSGQDPKFTKHASTWLTHGCWDDEPAKPIGGDMLDGNGNLIAPPPNYNPKRELSWDDVCGLNNRGLAS
jgi:Helix-turn-helix domain